MENMSFSASGTSGSFSMKMNVENYNNLKLSNTWMSGYYQKIIISGSIDGNTFTNLITAGQSFTGQIVDISSYSVISISLGGSESGGNLGTRGTLELY